MVHGDDVEARGFEDPLQVAGIPAVRLHDGVVERLRRVGVEVAEEQRTTGPQHARELGERRGDLPWRVEDRREPGQDAADRGIRFIDRLDALDVEPDARVGPAGVVDELR